MIPADVSASTVLPLRLKSSSDPEPHQKRFFGELFHSRKTSPEASAIPSLEWCADEQCYASARSRTSKDLAETGTLNQDRPLYQGNLRGLWRCNALKCTRTPQEDFSSACPTPSLSLSGVALMSHCMDIFHNLQFSNSICVSNRGNG